MCLQTTLLCFPEYDLHAIRSGSKSNPIDWSIIWLSCIFRPDELKLPQQCHNDEEELHTSQTLSETHTRTWDIKKTTTSKLFSCFSLIKPNLSVHATAGVTRLMLLLSLYAVIPAEKGMKASGLTNSPWSLRKFSGLKSWGNFHCPSSFSKEVRLGMISVPWEENQAGKNRYGYLVVKSGAGKSTKSWLNMNKNSQKSYIQLPSSRKLPYFASTCNNGTNRKYYQEIFTTSFFLPLEWYTPWALCLVS